MVQSMASKTFIDFNELCRLCATKTSIVLGFHIFQHEGDAKQILKKITSCLPIEVVAADKLPKMICEQCVFKLDMLFEFREKTIQTETFLLELLKSIEPEIQNKVQNGIEVTVLKQSQEQPHYTNCIELRNDVSAQEHQHTRNDNDQLPEEQLEDLLVVTASHHNICNNNREENCVMLNKTNVPAPSIHKDNNVKCEPDVLIKVEETINVHLNDSESETESDTDDDDENGDYNDDDEAENGSDSKYLATETQEVSKNEISVIQHKNFESHLPSERLSNHESISSSVMFDGSSTFVQSTISPAANGLLLLSCSQNPKLELKGGSFIFCNMCGKAYAEQEEFQTHYETHCNKCSVCSALFTNEDALNVHFQEMHLEHNNKKQIVEYRDGKKRKKQWVPKICKDCGKQYRTNYKLMEHMRKHTGEKPFTCTSCPKAFRSKIGLAQHEAKHTGNTSSHVTPAGKGFSVNLTLSCINVFIVL